MYKHLFVTLLVVYIADSRPQYNENPSRSQFRSNDYDNVEEYDDLKYNERRRTNIETTRILNSKPVRKAEDLAQGDQPSDFTFPGAVQYPKPKEPPKSPSGIRTGPFVPDMTAIKPQCGGSTFCETVDNYPSGYINQVLAQNISKYRDLLGTDVIASEGSNVSISTRIDITSDGMPMCPSRETVVTPKAAKNKEDQWLYIVNEDSYVQAIRVELCHHNGGKCAMSDSFPLNYRTECKQKYIYRKMLAMKPNGQPAPDLFQIPSCCVCYFRNDPKLRFGGGGGVAADGTSPVRRSTKSRK